MNGYVIQKDYSEKLYPIEILSFEFHIFNFNFEVGC